MPEWWPLIFGWPFVGVAIVLFGLGLLRRQFPFVLLGSFFAAPFCLYLSLTPRFLVRRTNRLVVKYCRSVGCYRGAGQRWRRF